MPGADTDARWTHLQLCTGAPSLVGRHMASVIAHTPTHPPSPIHTSNPMQRAHTQRPHLHAQTLRTAHLLPALTRERAHGCTCALLSTRPANLPEVRSKPAHTPRTHAPKGTDCVPRPEPFPAFTPCRYHTIERPTQRSLLIHARLHSRGFCYLWSTMVWKYYTENSRNKVLNCTPFSVA